MNRETFLQRRFVLNRTLCPQIELNYHLPLRGGLFYPLNYEDRTKGMSKRNPDKSGNVSNNVNQQS